MFWLFIVKVKRDMVRCLLLVEEGVWYTVVVLKQKGMEGRVRPCRC